jgi:Zn finger protein HypA/HybF involved in hydrogenase expression
MHTVFSPAIFHKDNVSCTKCHWTGHGSHIQQEELLLTDAIELYCPTCDGYMGFVSPGDDGE